MRTEEEIYKNAEQLIFGTLEQKMKISSLEGDMAEVGVARGGTAEPLAILFPQKTIYLFDTFTGIPDIFCEYDFTLSNSHHVGDFACDLEEVKNELSKYKNLVFHVGIFPQTGESIRNKRFCLVNIDVDIYQSTKDCWEYFYPRMVKGGVIIVYDDYSTLPGVEKATDDFLIEKPEILKKEGAAVYIEKL